MKKLCNDWFECTLADAVSPRGEKTNPQDEASMSFIGMDHVEAHTMKIVQRGVAGDMRSSCSRFYKTDLIYGRLRPYLNKVTVPSFDGLASAEFIVLPSNCASDSRFIAYRLNARDFVAFSNSLNEGDRPRVNFGQIGKFELHLPPILEQTTIVEKLETIFSELDQGVELLTTIQQQLKRYRQAVLKAAFEGKLTAQWRSQQTELPSADALLTQIKAERRERYTEQVAQWAQAVGEWEAAGGKDSDQRKPRKPTQPKDLPPMSEDELAELPELPDGWAWCRLNQVARLGTGTTPSRSNSAYWDQGTIPWVTSSVVNNEYCSEASEFVSELGADAARLQVYPKKSLLLAMYGEGKTRGKVTELLIDSAINQALAAICFEGISESCRVFIKRYLQRNYIQMRERSSGGVQPNLNLGLVSEMRIPVASIAEQAQIVEEIDFRLSVFEEIDQAVATGLKQSKALRQSILKMAFEGRLLSEPERAAVRVDPAYEPAEQLLERIKAEREQAKAAKPKRKTKAKMKKAPRKSKAVGVKK